MESATLSELADYRFEHVAIALVRTALGLRFEFTVEFKEGFVGQRLSVSGQHATKRGEYASFPVDESAVAVEGNGGEGGEIHWDVQIFEHGSSE